MIDTPIIARAEEELEQRDPVIKRESQACAAAIDKLTALIARLEDRLEPVRFRGPVPEDIDDLPVPGASQLGMDLRSYRESIQKLQRRIGDLLEELEI